MRIKKEVATKILIMFFFFFVGSDAVFSQPERTGLREKRITIEMRSASLGDVLGELMCKYNIPIGFEESILERDHNDFDFATNMADEVRVVGLAEELSVSISAKQIFPSESHKFDLSFKDAPLSEVFTSIVRQMKNYAWELDGDVVNIFPLKGRDNRYADLLNLKIAKFHVSSQSSVKKIRLALLSLPEVKDFVGNNNLSLNTLRGGFLASTLKKDVGIDLQFSNLTLRQLLNGIIRMKSGGWILKKHDLATEEGRDVIDIDI